MKLANKLLHLALLVCTAFFVLQVHADEKNEVSQLIQKIYSADIRGLLCRPEDGSASDEIGSKIFLSQYFSVDLMKYYVPDCNGVNQDRVIWFDPRSGEAGILSYDDSKPKLTNLKIEQPKIKGKHASIRTTYDLPVASYEQFKNFTEFSLIKENGQWKIDDIELGCHDTDKDSSREYLTSLPTIKSLKKFIKKGLAEHEAEKKAALKK